MRLYVNTKTSNDRWINESGKFGRRRRFACSTKAEQAKKIGARALQPMTKFMLDIMYEDSKDDNIGEK